MTLKRPSRLKRWRPKRRWKEPIFLSLRWRRRRRMWRGLFWFALLGLVTLPGIHWANFLLYQHQRYAAEPFLLPLLAPALGGRVLIVAPHPDDEVLGCAGLIQHLLQHGISPLVIVVTDGDGFNAAIRLKLREVRINPQDRVLFATMRRTETLSALKLLGLPPSHVVFLGFSERTLAESWLLKGDSQPIQALAEWMEGWQPTTVVLPSRYDDHPIHAVVCSLGWAALAELKEMHRLRQIPRVLEVLVHYGEFPRPQGLHPDCKLLPPTDLLLLARWYALPLSPFQRERKWRALQSYRTQQVPLTWRFLKSFVRANELFAEPFPLTSQPDRMGELRSLLAGLDIVRVQVDTSSLTFTAKLRGKGNRRFLYGVQWWQPGQAPKLLPVTLSDDKRSIVATLPPNFDPMRPTILTAFTGFEGHILDVAPLPLTKGVRP